jgi:hypothetical protein
MKILTLAPAALLCTATLALGATEELKPERLPADVQFVLHLDVESLMSTDLGRLILETRHQPGSDLGDLDELETKLGIDFLRDVHAITLYQNQGEEEPTVALFATSLAVDNALAAAGAEKRVQRVLEDGMELLLLKEDGESMVVYAHPPVGDRRTVVVASSKEKAMAAARVLRGQTPNHLSGGGKLQLTPAPGSFLYVSTGQLPDFMGGDDSPASHVLGLAQGIQVDLGEAGGFLTAHLALLTEMPERAREVANIVQGFVSLGTLALRGEAEELMELLRELRVSSTGNEVAIDFRYASRRLVEILKSVESGSHGHYDEDEDY